MAKVPNIARAEIAPRKLTAYLLARDHPDGGPKARFLDRFGFRVDNATLLRAALLAHVMDNDFVLETTNSFGTLYEVESPLASPDGRNPMVRVVWMIDAGRETPRLITLVPLRPP